MNGEDALQRALTGDYDLVLLDVSLPLLDGIEVLSQLKRERPGLPVLVLSMHPEEQYALRALRAGAAGYVTKDRAPEELHAAIRTVLEGGTYISPSARHLLASLIHAEEEQPAHRALSPREYQIMCLLASGKTVSETARELFLSVKTVSTHRARILKKLNLKTTGDLIRYATKNRLVE